MDLQRKHEKGKSGGNEEISGDEGIRVLEEGTDEGLLHIDDLKVRGTRHRSSTMQICPAGRDTQGRHLMKHCVLLV